MEQIYFYDYVRSLLERVSHEIYYLFFCHVFLLFSLSKKRTQQDFKITILYLAILTAIILNALCTAE
jgi:hypothetical protein